MVTIRDVGERARVSLGTVSRVLNGHPSVRPAVRASVNHAIRDLGYVPNPAARSLRSGRTHTLGLIVPDLLNPMTVALVRGVEDAGGRAGYTLLLAESRLDPHLEETHIAKLLERRVDGLLCSPVQSIAAVERCVKRPGTSVLPTVLLQLRRPRREFLTAYVDEAPAIGACTDYLLALGHRRVAIVHSSSHPAGGRHRRDVLRAALCGRGIDEGADLDRIFSEAAECYQGVREILARPDRPSVMLVGIHQFVPATLQAIRDAKLQIPADLSLVVFGDSDWARATTPPLSTIVVNQEEHAEGAVQLLLQVIGGEASTARHVRSESVYVVRESTGPAPKEGSR